MDEGKLPPNPKWDRLTQLRPTIKYLPPGNLFRVYFASGQYPTRWHEFRFFGPIDARFDHHQTHQGYRSTTPSRGIFYCSETVSTCIAEVFQSSRAIDPNTDLPFLVAFSTNRTLKLLDLTGTFPLKAGASHAINSGPREFCRNWSRGFYEAYEEIEGLYFRSSMTGAIALALYERVMIDPPFESVPIFHKQLSDQLMREPLSEVCEDIGYEALW